MNGSSERLVSIRNAVGKESINPSHPRPTMTEIVPFLPPLYIIVKVQLVKLMTDPLSLASRYFRRAIYSYILEKTEAFVSRASNFDSIFFS